MYYIQNPLSMTYVGLNFAGILKSLVIYRRFNYQTRFTSLSPPSFTNVETLIVNQTYPFILWNNLTTTLGSCERVFGDELKCESCSLHPGMERVTKKCFSSCDFNTFGKTC